MAVLPETLPNPTVLYLPQAGPNNTFVYELADAYVGLDAATSVVATSPARVTEYPVEDGSALGDNVVLAPVQLTVQGILSDTPANKALLAAAEGFLATQITQAIRQAGGSGGDLLGAANLGAGLLRAGAFIPDAQKAIRRFETLKAWWTGRKPVCVLTSDERYINMVITALARERTAKTGLAIQVSIQLTQLRIVASAPNGQPPVAPAIQPLAGWRQALGPLGKSVVPVGSI